VTRTALLNALVAERFKPVILPPPRTPEDVLRARREALLDALAPRKPRRLLPEFGPEGDMRPWISRENRADEMWDRWAE